MARRAGASVSIPQHRPWHVLLLCVILHWWAVHHAQISTSSSSPLSSSSSSSSSFSFSSSSSYSNSNVGWSHPALPYHFLIPKFSPRTGLRLYGPLRPVPMSYSGLWALGFAIHGFRLGGVGFAPLTAFGFGCYEGLSSLCSRASGYFIFIPLCLFLGEIGSRYPTLSPQTSTLKQQPKPTWVPCMLRRDA